MVAEEEVVMGVAEVAEVDVEVSRARMPHLWVEVDAGSCLLTHDRSNSRLVAMTNLTEPLVIAHCPEPRPAYRASNFRNVISRLLMLSFRLAFGSGNSSLDLGCIPRHHTAAKTRIHG